MDTPHRRRGAVVLLSTALAGLLVFAGARLIADDRTIGELEIRHPQVPPTPPGASSAAGYLVIVNGGDEDDRLTGGSAAFASGVELHRTTVEDDVARMRRLDDGLVIPAGETVRLEPGGMHLMLTGLAEALPDGERRAVTLSFERAGDVEIEFAVERAGAGDRTMDHGEMDHGETGHDEMDHGDTDDDGTDHGPATR